MDTLHLKGMAEALAVYSAELAAIACKTGGKCMTIKRYELLSLSSLGGPSAMVTESEGTYVLHADHVAEVAVLKEDNERLKALVAKLVEALDRISNLDSMSYHSLESAKIVARVALATYRKGEEV